jgi:hypothetical protein
VVAVPAPAEPFPPVVPVPVSSGAGVQGRPWMVPVVVRAVVEPVASWVRVWVVEPVGLVVDALVRAWGWSGSV